MPDGTLIQWGRTKNYTASPAAITVTLPLSFIDTNYSVTTANEYVSSAYIVTLSSVQRVSAQKFNIYYRQAYYNAEIQPVEVDWIAIGRWK